MKESGIKAGIDFRFTRTGRILGALSLAILLRGSIPPSASVGGRIIDNISPIVSAGPDEVIVGNEPFTQTGRVTDPSPSSGIARVIWDEVAGPADGKVVFENPNSLTTRIDANRYGTYLLRLTAIDNAGNQSSNTFELVEGTTHPLGIALRSGIPSSSNP